MKSFDKIEGTEKNIPVPDGLERRIESVIIASELIKSGVEEKSVRSGKLLFGISVAFASVAVALFFVFHNPVKDTFDDPQEAYAEVSAALRLISSEVEKGYFLASGDGVEIYSDSNTVE